MATRTSVHSPSTAAAGFPGSPDARDLAGTGRGTMYDDWYASYLQRIEPYKGTSFYEQLLNNPYASYQSAPLNWFQQQWYNMTGTSAAATNFYNQRFQSAEEYMSQILDAQRQQNYNDPAAQEARRQAAGFNDQLNGGEAISSGEAAEATPDDTPPVPGNVTDDLQELGQITQVGFSLFSNFMSIAGGFQQLYGSSLDLSSKELALTESGWDSIVKLAAESSDWTLPEDQKITDLTDEDLDRMVMQNTRSLLDRLNNGEFRNMYDRKRTKQLVNRLGSMLGDGGTDTLAYQRYRSQLLKEIVGNTDDAAQGVGKFGFSGDILRYGRTLANTFGDIEKEARKAVSALQKAQAGTAQAQERIANAQAGYSEEYYSPELGQVEGQAGIATAEAIKAQQHLDSYVDKQLDDLMDSLKGNNDLGSTILMFLIPTARSVIKALVQQSLGNVFKPASAGITINTN